MDTSRLLASAQAGDKIAWQAIVDRYQSMLWSVTRGFRLSDSDAQDAIQLTWLHLVERLDGIRDPDALGGWLATTVRRECLQVLRRSGRVRTVDDPVWELLPDGAPEVDHQLLLDERDAALWKVFEELNDKCRRLLRVLMATPAPSYQEVSAALDIPTGSIGPTRQRCLGRLRDLAAGHQLLGTEGAS